MDHGFSVGDRVYFEYAGFTTVGRIVDFDGDGDAVIRSAIGRVHVAPESLGLASELE